MLSRDWIEIRDGKDENSTLIGNRICGNKCDTTGCVGPYSSSGNVLYLHFHSQESRSKGKVGARTIPGFKIKVVSESGVTFGYYTRL